MPYAHTHDNPLPTVPVKWYTVIIEITTTRRRYLKEVSGLTNAHATARQIADGTVQAAQAVADLFYDNASVWCGPVLFGPEHRGHLPNEGFYVDGRRVPLPNSKREKTCEDLQTD